VVACSVLPVAAKVELLVPNIVAVKRAIVNIVVFMTVCFSG